MTTQDSPDFALGMAEKLAPTGAGASGNARPATAHVGHAVTRENRMPGERASQAVCGEMTTLADPMRPYHPDGGASYLRCPTCAQQVEALR